ncbi:MAG TPA: hypothetical protein VGB64_03260 [Actinomycetota bacterium]
MALAIQVAAAQQQRHLRRVPEKLRYLIDRLPFDQELRGVGLRRLIPDPREVRVDGVLAVAQRLTRQAQPMPAT